ncbi:hypothetical protein O181_076578 [Austropuccinia psidii MF-1]|uniref:Reverse transcriptase/retrotransposon-derived protein RNase H-like domain-containing protein n=1 Tax=Austropuccinia psidii MF-1 TaxID=1389203 RepID=A0A9Q3FF97_9BASI|nr:hypothetical protein [Austropuccinia psidii MF-1]
MDTIFEEQISEFWRLVYIYYIIIYSETWEDHLQYIERVLSKFTPINLKISLKECNFAQKELLELGHKVSVLILAIDQNKVEAVLQNKYQRTSNRCNLSLGLLATTETTSITKERRDAYERIKHKLTNAPVLIIPKFELPFNLYIDAACSQGLGATLHQR